MINADTSFEKIFLTKDEHSTRTLVFVHRRVGKMPMTFGSFA